MEVGNNVTMGVSLCVSSIAATGDTKYVLWRVDSATDFGERLCNEKYTWLQTGERTVPYIFLFILNHLGRMVRVSFAEENAALEC